MLGTKEKAPGLFNEVINTTGKLGHAPHLPSAIRRLQFSLSEVRGLGCAKFRGSAPPSSGPFHRRAPRPGCAEVSLRLAPRPSFAKHRALDAPKFAAPPLACEVSARVGKYLTPDGKLSSGFFFAPYNYFLASDPPTGGGGQKCLT